MLKEIKKFYNQVKVNKYFEDDEGEVPITYVKVFHKEYPRLPYFKLPKVDKQESEFETLLDYRESHRNFSDIPLTLEELSKIIGSCRLSERLFSIADNNDKVERRTYPSGGARFPVELYYLSYNTEGLEKGAYHYNITKSILEQLLKEDFTKIKRELISPYLENPAGTIIFTSVLSRSEIKYGHRAYPYSLIEAGHMGQNILLASSEIGIGSCPISGFVDTRINEILDLTENEIPIYSISLGHIKKG
jgi:SagB-type dehydrogenase family enzyme